MLHRLVIIFALCLPLVAVSPGRGEDQAPVTVLDTDALQLKTLSETEKKLAALARLPEEGSAVQRHEAPKNKKKAQQRKRVRKKVEHAAAAVSHGEGGQRLTVGKVKEILAGSRDLSGADLTGLDLSGMDLSGVNFSRADLSRANLATADLSEADFLLADLTNANFTRASLRMARLHGTRTWGARFDGALWVDRTVCRSGSLGRCVQ